MKQERLMKVLLGPLVSEKSANAADSSNQVVFKVVTDATKPEIKAAVKLMFEVDVESVQTSNVTGKSKRSQGKLGKRKDWKKAYVRVKAGQDITFAGGE